MAKLLLSVLVLFCSPTLAETYYELGLTGNYRKSSIDQQNFQETISYTGSFSYYFWQMSALELSYTRGIAELSVQPLQSPKVVTTSSFEMLGLDLVLTFADRQAPFQPYVKAGAAHISKKIYRQAEGFNTSLVGESSGVVPSAGLGSRVLLTERFSLRVGLDFWTSPVDESPLIVDFAGRVGISWIL